MPTNCTITFERANGIYYGGETFNGHIKLETTKIKSIRGIYIKIIGFAHVKWKEQRGRNSCPMTYSAHEKYLDKVIYVLGSKAGPSFDLAPGTYNHSFSYNLSDCLPTSLSEEYGRIEYQVKVKIDRKFRFDQVFEKSFVVIDTLDLNDEPAYKLPKSVEKDNSLIFKGDVSALLKIPCSAYVPGQAIPFDFTIKNGSNSVIKGSKVKLEKCYIFKSHKPTRRFKEICDHLHAVEFGQVLRYSTKEFHGFLQLPTVLECTEENRIITTIYRISGKVYMGYFSFDIRLNMSVVIGTDPIIDNPQFCGDDGTVLRLQPTAPSAPQYLIENNENIVSQSSDMDRLMADNNREEKIPSYESALRSENNKNNSIGLESEDPNLPKYPVVVRHQS